MLDRNATPGPGEVAVVLAALGVSIMEVTRYVLSRRIGHVHRLLTRVDADEVQVDLHGRDLDIRH
jgi:hypothetical protein